MIAIYREPSALSLVILVHLAACLFRKGRHKFRLMCSCRCFFLLYGTVLLIPQFCPHRPGTVVEQQGMETCDWSISGTAVHIGPDLYRMCPYGSRSHIRRLRFSALFCVSPTKSRYRNDCGPVAHLIRTGTEENLKKTKNLESARNWPLKSQ